MGNECQRSSSILKIGLCFVVLIGSGCTSFRSTIVNRTSDDSLRPQCGTRTTCGVPVKLKVPSHMEVKIVETFFLHKSTSSDGSGDPEIYGLRAKTDPKAEKGDQRILNVVTELIYTDKVFTVDFPRPFAGTLSLTSSGKDGINFDSEQYFSSIRGSYKEKTIETVSSIVGGLAGQGTSAINYDVLNNDKYRKLTRVVAFDRFDINECGWEGKMHLFINQHLGHCNQPCGVVNCVNCSPEESAPDEPSYIIVQPAATTHQKSNDR